MHPTMQIRIASEFVPNWIQHRSAVIPAREPPLGPSRTGIDAQRRSGIRIQYRPIWIEIALRSSLMIDHQRLSNRSERIESPTLTVSADPNDRLRQRRRETSKFSSFWKRNFLIRKNWKKIEPERPVSTTMVNWARGVQMDRH